MTNYVPFLKLKVNEIGALKTLSTDIKEKIVPFFDLVKRSDTSEVAFEDMVKRSATSVAKNLKGIHTFYLDNFDIDDQIIINKKNNYAFVIESFSDTEFIPVVGLDRTAGRNKLVFDYKKDGAIKSSTIAIRLVAEDFKSFDLVRDEIGYLLEQGDGLFAEWHLILDNRVCMNIDVNKRTSELVQFIKACAKVFDFYSIIVVGSSIPSSIKEILPVESEIAHVRTELRIYTEAAKELGGFNLCLGDYTIVSPLYSDLDIPPEAMLNVIAPKVIYSHGSVHYIGRGGALRTHARGSMQYNDIAKKIISQPFYRGVAYSFGDEFLDEKANFVGNSVTPSSILKPTINTHITYMFKNFVA